MLHVCFTVTNVVIVVINTDNFVIRSVSSLFNLFNVNYTIIDFINKFIEQNQAPTLEINTDSLVTL